MPVDFPVAVSGAGVISAAGSDADEFLSNLRNGEGGIGPVEGDDFAAFEGAVGGQVSDTELRPRLEKLGISFDETDRAVALALVAVSEAVARSGLDLTGLDRRRIGLVLGKCQSISRSPVAGTAALTSAQTADAVAHHLGLCGVRILVSTACAAGTNAIGVGCDKLRTGEADVVIAGGFDDLRPATFGGFFAMHAMSPAPCAPYNESAGMNLGEGAAFLVLEPLAAARLRGAPILGEVLGYGLSADAHHMTAPDPRGRGAILAMERALDDAGRNRADVDYVNGHGTGTPANDRMERTVQRTFFGPRQVPLSSTKSFTGHALGASGVMEAVASLLAIQHRFVPPTLQAREDDPELDYVPNAARPADLRIVLSNNFAFGGNNASIIYARARRDDPPRPTPKVSQAVTVTGIGAVGALGLGIDAWRGSLDAGRTSLGPLPEVGPGAFGIGMPSSIGGRWASPHEWRQMSRLARHTLIASRLAVDDADLPLGRSDRQRTGLFMGTANGPLAAAQALELEDLLTVSPILLAQATPNVPAGITCQVLGLRGPTSTITMGAVSGTLALAAAIDSLDRGDVAACVVVATDELEAERFRQAQRLGVLTDGTAARPYDPSHPGLVLGESAVALVVEPLRSAEARGARRYADIRSVRQGSECLDGLALDPTRTRWGEVVCNALDVAEVPPSEVGFCAGSASGGPGDDAEIDGLGQVFDEDLLVAAPKSLTGYCTAASGLINVIVAALALQTGRPPMAATTLASLRGHEGVRRREPDRLTAAAALDVEFGASYTATVLTAAVPC